MYKRRSQIEFSLSDYYFAVSPISLLFGRQYNTRFHLYFERNLQIISKHQSPATQVKKNQIIYFSPPEQIQHFRIHNQKSMDYEWNLYIFRVDIQGDNEQLVQRQNICLKQEWNAFKSSRGTLYRKNIKFNSIVCTLNYMFVIGGNNQELLDTAQKYFGQNNMSLITSNQNVSILQIQVQKQLRTQRESSSQKMDQVGKYTKTQIVAKIQQIKRSQRVNRDRNSLERQMSLVDLNNHIDQQLLSMKEESHNKLSLSQIEIGQQIEQKVNHKENHPKLKTIVQTGKLATKPQISGQKSIRVISSQLLNQKKQVILPLHQQKTYIITFIITIILIFASGIWILGSHGPKIGQKATKKKSKQMPSKKTKVKK